jgi:hypothetical protein
VHTAPSRCVSQLGASFIVKWISPATIARFNSGELVSQILNVLNVSESLGPE